MIAHHAQKLSGQAHPGKYLGNYLVISLTLALAPLIAACAPSASGGAATPPQTPRATSAPTYSAFEEGIAFPRWGGASYGPDDQTWPSAVAAMQAQTHAQWVEMIVAFTQADPSSVTVSTSGATTPHDLSVGVTNARQAGLRVYLKPLLSVRDIASQWNGAISFSSHAAAQQWFASYWAAYKPYVQAAASAGASQVSIGAEYSALQSEYPDLWEWLIQQASGVFHGPLTYELNHDAIAPPPTWLSDPLLTYIGVSMYTSLQATPQDLPASQIEQLWAQDIIAPLDQLSLAVGKRIVLSEVGYRDASDCLYDPWQHTTSAPADPALQGAAYQAALTETMRDSHVVGDFFWAWQNGIFTPGAPAIQALRAAYH